MEKIRKFEANKGSYAYFLALAGIVPLIYIWFLSRFIKELLPLGVFAFLPFLFLLWIYLTTSYSIKGDKLYYRSAFVHGAFAISEIKEIKMSARPDKGQRPAMANYGMLILYGKGEQVFIAPSKPAAFLNNVRKYNRNIVMTHESSEK